MKKIFLLLAVVFFTHLNFAQNIPFQIQKSEIFTDDATKSSIVLAEKYNTNDILIVRSYNNNGISLNEGFYIEQYDNDLELKKEFNFEIKHSNNQKYNIVIGVFTIRNNITIVEIYYDLNRKSYVCQANYINSDFKVSKKELFSFSKDEAKDFGMFSLQEKFNNKTNTLWINDNSGDINSELENIATDNRTKSDIVLVINKSKTNFAVAIDFNDDKRDDLKLYLFDENLNKINDTVFSRDVKDDKYVFQNIQVSDEDTSVYVMAKSYSDELKNKKTGGKYFFEVTKITPSTQKSLRIDTDEHYLSNLKIYTEKDKLVALGFYSNISDKPIAPSISLSLHFPDYKYDGLYSCSINSSTMLIENSTFNPFSSQFITDKFGSEKQNEFYKLQIRNINFSEQNDIYINAEEEIISFSSGGVGIGVGTKTDTNYTYGDITCLKLDSIGNLIWSRNINKKQSYSNENSFYLSYCSLFKANNTYVFLNAGEKIKDLSEGRIQFKDVSKNKSNLNLLHLSPNGDFDYEEILDDENSVVPFMVSNGIIVNESVFFLGRKGNKKQLLKVTLSN